MHNMLIRPTAAAARDVRRARLRHLQRRRLPGEPPHRGHDVDDVDRPVVRRREFVILGTEYAGEMKKGVFTIMNYLMPKQGVLSMHCSATQARDGERHVDPVRPVGHRQDDAVGRSEAPADRRRRALLERRRRVQHRGRLLREGDQAVEGAGARHLERAPVRRGARERRCTTRTRASSTTTTRRSPRTRAAATSSTRSRTPSCPRVGGHPKNVIFLTADAFGVLPPVVEADARRRRCTTSSRATPRRSRAPRSA